MWKKINDNRYELKADKNFAMEFDTTWQLLNYYNGQKDIIEGLNIEEILEDGFNTIVTKFFGDIIKTAQVTNNALEILDKIVNGVLEENPEKSVTIFGANKESLSLKALVPMLKQHSLEIVVSSKITNHMEEK